MNMDFRKKSCAAEALKYIENDTTIGLGGGSTISYLIGNIKKADLRVKVVTPSFTTASLCVQNGLQVVPTWSVDRIAVAFDGCDEVDEQLHALKSGGGIHTKEKLIASMADHYILLVDETKLVNKLTFKHPVVLEIVMDALSYVQHSVKSLGSKPEIRTSASKDGYTVSDHGNVLLDVFFDKVEDSTALQTELKAINGVIETSLFTKEVTSALVAGSNGIKVISK